jgi:hypothetical protein
VIDLCSVQANNTQYLAALSKKVLSFYNFELILIILDVYSEVTGISQSRWNKIPTV